MSKSKRNTIFKNNKNSKRAVSPVIGVILMLTITVIVAGAIGSQVFSLKEPHPAPVVSFHTENEKYSDNGTFDVLKIKHHGGNSIFLQGSSTKMLVNQKNVNLSLIKTDEDKNFDVGDEIYIWKSSSNEIYAGSIFTVESENGSRTKPGKNLFQNDEESNREIDFKIIDINSNQIIFENKIEFY